MKDDKEDDTVRYKNTLDSHENSITNNNNDTSDEKIWKIKQEKKIKIL